MDFEQLFSEPIYSIGDTAVGIEQILWLIVFSGLILVTYRLLIHRWLPKFAEKNELSSSNQKSIKRLIQSLFLFIFLVICVQNLGVDFAFINQENLNLKVSTLLTALAVLQFARLINWVFSQILLPKIFKTSKEAPQQRNIQPTEQIDAPTFTIQYIVYMAAILVMLYHFNLDYQLYSFGEDAPLKISNVLYAVLILLLARILSWVIIRVFLNNYYQRKEIHVGTQFAINQILRYALFFIAFLMSLQALNLNLTLLWVGSGTILLGIGLGLQQTFTDLISGIILLFERTVEVGAIIELEDDLIGEVRSIGWRTSEIETRDGVTVVVPNSKLISNNFINWSHSGDKARFSIEVGVAYGSDTDLVKKVLLETAKAHSLVIPFPPPKVRFINFGDSALEFELLFWSRNFLIIEDIKSDLRFEVDQVFRENGIEIPFPQRDVWFKNTVEGRISNPD